jgi:hypothetical protein
VSSLTIRNCWHKAGILPEGWIAGASADTTATEDAADVFKQLDAALQGLKVCVRKHGALLPHNDAMLSANEFHELDGEREVKSWMMLQLCR